MSLDRPPINSGVPHSARIWNYWLGGKDCYQIDRQVGDQIRSLNPEIVDIARAQRAFLKRAVTYLAGEVGIRQFLDVGTGLPTHDNTHEVAQSVAPESRIVYVDHDPVVLQHAHTLLAGTPEGATDYIEADLRDPGAILRAARATLDFERPVALMLLGIAAHIPDDSAYGLVGELKSALPAGSHLVFCDSTEVFHPAEMRAMVERWNEAGDNPRVNRTPDQLARFFTGFDLLPPGLVPVADWHAPADDPSRRDVDSFGGVALKH